MGKRVAPFEIYPPDPQTTWRLQCDECWGSFLPEEITSFRVVRTDFHLCEGCFEQFREGVGALNDSAIPLADRG